MNFPDKMPQTESLEVITTIGPASASNNILTQLKEAGATRFRINLSHSTPESLEDYFTLFKSSGIKPSIDTQGAQIRVSDSNPKKEYYSEGDRFIIGSENSSYIKEEFDICINHVELFRQISKGDLLKIGFNGLTIEIIDIDNSLMSAEGKVISAGKVERNKAIDIDGRRIALSSLTEFDIYAIKKGLDFGIDAIFYSFTNCVEDILKLNDIIRSHNVNGQKPRVIAKIETELGLINLRSIIKEVDGILVDRGDLSREIKISKIPLATKAVIKSCKEMNTPCYIATNVLDSMMINPLPSGAEISDLYNLYELGISGIVLAAEVAIGRHPVECVHIVRHIYSLHKYQERSLLGVVSDHNTGNILPTSLSKWL